LIGVPVVLLLAGVLAAEGASFVLVGSGALRLRGEPVSVGDIDVVIEPEKANLRRLLGALGELALRPRVLPSPVALEALDIVTVVTSYGRLDCMLGRGRLEWEPLAAGADVLEVAGVGVVVAGADDAWRLRRAFKG
jgi:hypothetical protein